jgi:flagellar protein FlgJ
MSAPVTRQDVYTDFQGLSELRARAQNNGEDVLREVAGQFEALFIQMMLQSMRDATLGEGLLDSEHTKTYQSMFDKQIAIDLSKRQGLGLAEMMVRQLSGAQADHGDAAPLPAPHSPVHQRLVHPLDYSPGQLTAAETAIEPVEPEWTPGSPQQFVEALWPHAQRAARRLGTEPEVLVAQAALETGWGRHMMPGPDGGASFNLFGIKADARWQGNRVTTGTVEFRDGVMRKERASFRAYSSLAEAFADYTEFLQANPRYSDALSRAGSGPAFARALADAGYATDPDYASKINAVMNSRQLREAVSGIKESAPEPLS